MKVFLCGFMGSGKSSLMSRVKKGSGAPVCIDLDTQVLQLFGSEYSSLGEYIQSVGFEIFRKNEQSALQDLVNSSEEMLVALGGGSITPEFLSSVAQTEGHYLVWLNTPFEQCWQRVKNDSNRPLVAQGRESLEKLYLERIAQYKLADLVLDPAEQEQISSWEQLILSLK